MEVCPILNVHRCKTPTSGLFISAKATFPCAFEMRKGVKRYQTRKPEKTNCITIKRKMEKSDRRIDEQKQKEMRLVKTAAAFVVRQIGIFDDLFLNRLSDDLITIENIKIVKQFLYKYTDDEYDSFTPMNI